MDDLLDQEAKLALKLRRLLSNYDLETLLSIADVDEAILEFNNVIEIFEDVHVKLRRGMGVEYSQTFEELSVTMAPYNDWLLQARRRSCDLRRAAEDEKSDTVQEVVEQMSRLTSRESEDSARWEAEREERKSKLRNAWKRLANRAKADLATIATVNSEHQSDLTRDIAHIRQLLKELSDLDQELETVFATDYNEEFPTVDEYRVTLNDAIRQLMDRSQQCQTNEMRVKAQVERNKEFSDQQSRDRENREKFRFSIR